MIPPDSGLTITRLGLPGAPEDLRFYNSMLSNVVFTNVITPNVSEQMVYGRNEPLVVYKNTTRTINLSFTIVSSTRRTLNVPNGVVKEPQASTRAVFLTWEWVLTESITNPKPGSNPKNNFVFVT